MKNFSSRLKRIEKLLAASKPDEPPELTIFFNGEDREPVRIQHMTCSGPPWKTDSRVIEDPEEIQQFLNQERKKQWTKN